MRLGIIVITYNIDTRIFILQMECIKKYCKDANYTVEIIDNSKDEEKATAIKHHAGAQGVLYKRVRSATPDVSKSHSFAANLSYSMLRDTYDYFFYLDHDCIPVKDFSAQEMLGENIIAGVRSGAAPPYYYWPGCLVWNNNAIDKKLINFSPNNALKLDTGGELYKVIEKYGEDKCLFFDEVGCENEHFRDTPLYYFYMMIYMETFMHFINASNWNPTEGNEIRLNSLINIATNKINELQIGDTE